MIKWRRPESLSDFYKKKGWRGQQVDIHAFKPPTSVAGSLGLHCRRSCSDSRSNGKHISYLHWATVPEVLGTPTVTANFQIPIETVARNADLISSVEWETSVPRTVAPQDVTVAAY